MEETMTENFIDCIANFVDTLKNKEEECAIAFEELEELGKDAVHDLCGILKELPAIFREE